MEPKARIPCRRSVGPFGATRQASGRGLARVEFGRDPLTSGSCSSRSARPLWPCGHYGLAGWRAGNIEGETSGCDELLPSPRHRPPLRTGRRPVRPLPRSLAVKLAAMAKGRDGEDLLFEIPANYTRDFKADIETAKITPETPEGKAVFHSLRKAYTTLLQELSGASLSEAQKLSRHSTPTLTSNTYTKTAGKRLLSLVDDLGARLLA